MLVCSKCGEVFDSMFEKFQHEQECQGAIISIRVSLKDISLEGRAKRIIAAMAQAQEAYPGKSFQIVPVRYVGGVLKEVLLIG